MKLINVTNSEYNDQLLYFTSPSITEDNKNLVFISDRTGNPNIFVKNFKSDNVTQLSNNTEGTLKSYVYFYGNENKGLGKASISLDPKRRKVYYLQGTKICCADFEGNVKVLNEIPHNQVSAYTHISADGKRICVPTTDKRALEMTPLTPDPSFNNDEMNRFILTKPDFDIDERVRTENLSSYIRVFSTETGEELYVEEVNKAWITHVQFSPVNSELILYNNEWPSDCGIRRLWLFDNTTKTHKRLRTEGEWRTKEDWTCHEMWQVDGEYIIYHGEYTDKQAYIGRVSIDGNDIVEIGIDRNFDRYGHFTVGNNNKDWLVSDGYYHPEGKEKNDNMGGEYISIQKVDWDNKKIEWVPLCEHKSFWDCQDTHPHPIFAPNDKEVYFTSNRDGNRQVYKVDIE